MVVPVDIISWPKRFSKITVLISLLLENSLQLGMFNKFNFYKVLLFLVVSQNTMLRMLMHNLVS